jgi:hypothetical protein
MVAPKATQSEPEEPVAGTIVVTKPMITWLHVTYGMKEEFLRNQTPSWVTWLDHQRHQGIDPNDAMLVNPFVPDDHECLRPHLPTPVLIPTLHSVFFGPFLSGFFFPPNDRAQNHAQENPLLVLFMLAQKCLWTLRVQKCAKKSYFFE